MEEVNRSVAIIKPKQPFVDWINNAEKDENPITPAEASRDCTAVLVPDYEYVEDMEEYLEANYQDIFENELESWYTDDKLWPQNRTLEMFRAWFEIEFHSLVMDLGDDEIDYVDYTG